MRLLRTVRLGVRSLFKRSQFEADLNDELQDYVEHQTSRYVESGLSPEEAHIAALRDVGGIENVRENCRDTWTLGAIENFRRNIGFGFRQLRRNPGFSSVAILIIALGIGATTAMFSVVDAVLLRPLPYRDPHRLVTFFEDLGRIGYPRARVSPPTYLNLKAQRQVFQDVAAVNESAFNLSGNNSGAQQLNGILATYNLFSVLGVNPLLGRTFLPQEDQPGANQVVVLSYAFWQSRFGGDAGIIGQTLRLNAEPFTVIGVMPPGFSFPEKEFNSVDLWTPRAFTSEELTPHRGRYLLVVGRLNSGVNLNQVNAGLRILADQEIREYPDDMQGVSRFFAEPLQQSDTHEAKSGLLMLLLAGGFIFLIACANVANLLLSRAAARRREIALRAALGAGRGRIISQLLTESGLLSITGGILGTCLAVASFGLLKYLVPADLSHSTLLHFNLPVLVFTILICLGSSFLFGLAPALQISKTDLNEALREAGRGSTISKHVLGNTFVAAEIALSLMLLVGCGLLLKSLYKLPQVDPGFQSTHVLTLDFDMAEPRYRDWNVRMKFQKQLLEQVRALPGVESAGLTGDLPLTSKGWNEDVTPEGSSAHRDRPANVIYGVITPGYLEALGVRLLHGRYFDDRDGENAPLVAIVNQKAAQDFWPNQNPIGKRLKLGRLDSNHPWLQVVGVTADVRHAGLIEPAREGVYCPYLQARSTLQWQRFLVVKTNADPLGILGELRRVAVSIDAEEPLNHIMTTTDMLERETAQNRMRTTLLGVLAGLALIMASAGIYGVMAYLVAQRTQEIGVRMALGAQKKSILGMVLKRGLRLASIGTIVGVCGAFALTRLLGSLLFGVSPTDIGVLACVTGVLALAATLACLVPAQRAASIDPIEALRTE
jgi:putative ABC transport system permease protein